jgi:hypothetical protein
MPINLRKNCNELERRWFSIIRGNNEIIVEEWFNKVELNHYGDENTGYHTFKVKDLQAGKYELNFLNGNE